MKEDKIMKNIFKTISLSIAAVTVFAACESFDQMNKNPYVLYDAPAESFVQPITFKTQYSMLSVFRNVTSDLMQYSVNLNTEVTSKVVANYNVPEASDDDIWQNLYTQLGNVEYMITKAEKDENPAMLGVAYVLKVLVSSIITDAYGPVPYFSAGKITLEPADSMSYVTKYDGQKEIYQDLLCLCEKANACFNQAQALVGEGSLTSADFSPLCDYMFDGSADRWQRFGNALYLRLLMRVSGKVIEESEGILELSDGSSVYVPVKIAELYDCFLSGSGNYPMMRGREDGALVEFNEDNASFQTPFFSTTSGIWRAKAACETIQRTMLDVTKVDKKYTSADGTEKIVSYYQYLSPEKGGRAYDPRWDCYFHKTVGMPTQMLYTEADDYVAAVISSAGNSLIGRMSYGVSTAITGKKFDLQNADHYALMNFSEQMFLFAEAGLREYIAISYPEARSVMMQAVRENILEWRDDLDSESQEVVDYLAYVQSQVDPDNAIQQLITQKWISLFFNGIESWCEYRRTGYPLLKTNGPAAENGCILPTRLRYPADEAYRNVQYYPEALDKWFGGTNNMTTDVWWASTAESQAIRLKGRK